MTLPLLDRILVAVINAILALMVVIAGGEVFCRYVLETSIPWAFEASLALLSYLTFIGGYVALRTRAHLRVDFVIRRLPMTGRIVVFVLNQAAIGLIAYVFTVWGWQQAFAFAGQLTPVMGMPMSWLYIIVPISGAAMLAQVAWDVWIGIQRLAAGLPPEDLDAGTPLDDLGKA